MQEKNNNIKTLSCGCRLNALESEKIKKILTPLLNSAIIVNTCAVTGEAERQSGQALRKISRENPDTPIFITGCAATRNPALFAEIPNTCIVSNFEKLNPNQYINAVQNSQWDTVGMHDINLRNSDVILSKQFVQVQNGCNHNCAYCITRQLRGNAQSFEYKNILQDAIDAVNNGFGEIVLTGVDIASYARDKMLISDICKQLLNDVPKMQRLRLSSLDPASPEIFKIIELIKSEPRMMPHIHLSMQSGSDSILQSMRRRHNAETVRKITHAADNKVTFSWDIICGFPGETDALFQETLGLIQDTCPIRIHAFPFSPRPGTDAATMPGQVARNVSKSRVKTICDAAEKNLRAFMESKINKMASVLVENNNIARTENDIAVKITNPNIPARTICDIEITGIKDNLFFGEIK